MAAMSLVSIKSREGEELGFDGACIGKQHQELTHARRRRRITLIC